MPTSFDHGMNMQRTGSMDSATYDGYSVNSMPTQPMYPTSNHGMPNMPPMTPQHMQYQQAMMAAASRPSNSYFPNSVAMNSGYPSPAQSMDAFRANVSSPIGMNSPLMPQAGFGAPPGFGVGNSQGMFQGYPM